MDRPWLKFYDEGVPHSMDYPEVPIYHMLDEAADRFHNRFATCFFGSRITYGRLKELADRFASSLQAIGLEPGDRVALIMPNFPGYLISYYGLLKAGMVLVPLNPLYTPKELEFFFTNTSIKAVVTIPMFLGKVLDVARRTGVKRVVYFCVSSFLPRHLGIVQWFRERFWVWRASRGGVEVVDGVSLLNRSTSPFKPPGVDPRDVALIIYSGGTTGVAKGIMLSHFSVVANAHMIKVWGDLNEDERILTVLPLFHGYGMNVCMNAPVLSGVEMVLLPRFSPSLMAKTISRFRPTLTAVVPTMLVALSNLPDIERYDFTSLKAIWVGAAPLTKAVKEEFEAKTGGRLIEGYGLTEAVTAIMANPYRGMHKVGSIGIPFPDVYAKVVSVEDGRDLPCGEQGEILLRTPTVMLGYYNMPDETREVIKDGWLHTGDIGYMDEDGYFYITDRKKDLIIVGGFNVFPREIDEVIQRHPKVKEGVAVGIPDPYKGERIKAYIVLKEGETATEEEFIEYFREHLISYKVPSEVEFRSSLPKNAIGKVLRRVLREEEIKRQQGSAE